MTHNKDSKPKYSEMLISIVEKFSNQLPEELAFEDILDVVIDSWNLANNKSLLVEKNIYIKELKAHKYSDITEKIVDYKIKKYPNFKNLIVDYETKDNLLQVKTQSQENHFDDLLRQMVNYNPNKKENS